MKAKTKAKAMSAKGSGKPHKGKADGRQNPGQLDRGLNVLAGKAVKKLANETTHTPVTHQSGKGTRGLREGWRGYSKTGLIRVAAAAGRDKDQITRGLRAIGIEMMTAGVMAKNMALADEAPEMSADDRKQWLSVCK